VGPFWELVAGFWLTIGFLSTLSAVILTVICVVACRCEAAIKVARYNPIDPADRLDDYLYLPEVLYLNMLAVVILAGPGNWRVM
jgi:uncharacterized membrane protein YphA (DoxX/SURF4 family)